MLFFNYNAEGQGGMMLTSYDDYDAKELPLAIAAL